VTTENKQRILVDLEMIMNTVSNQDFQTPDELAESIRCSVNDIIEALN